MRLGSLQILKTHLTHLQILHVYIICIYIYISHMSIIEPANIHAKSTSGVEICILSTYSIMLIHIIYMIIKVSYSTACFPASMTLSRSKTHHASMNFMRPHSVIVRLFDGNEFQCPKSQTEKNISEKQLMLNNFRVAGIWSVLCTPARKMFRWFTPLCLSPVVLDKSHSCWSKHVFYCVITPNYRCSHAHVWCHSCW